MLNFIQITEIQGSVYCGGSDANLSTFQLPMVTFFAMRLLTNAVTLLVLLKTFLVFGRPTWEHALLLHSSCSQRAAGAATRRLFCPKVLGARRLPFCIGWQSMAAAAQRREEHAGCKCLFIVFLSKAEAFFANQNNRFRSEITVNTYVF